MAMLFRLSFPIPRRLREFGNGRIRFILCLLITVCILQGFNHIYIHVKESAFFHQYYTSVIQAIPWTPGPCQIPVVDPWDERVKPYVYKLSPIQCGKPQPLLTEMLDNGVLQWNYTELKHLAIDPHTLECRYQTFRKSDCDDDTLDIDKPRIFPGHVKLKDEFVNISCRRKDEFYDFYTNVHFWVPVKPVKRSNNSIPLSEYPNICILVLDSMSQANLIRQMPKTFQTFTQTLKGHLMSGVIKIGENTFPNMVPMLTGRRPRFAEDGLPTIEREFFDDWPFIWKNFSQVGYTTAWAEDEPTIALFNYLAKGFRKQPTDYYMRPYWLVQKSSPLRYESKRWCFGNLPNHYFLLSWLYKVQATINAQKRPFFLMSILSEVTHDDLNTPQLADASIARFLQKLHESGNLNNTIMFLIGDHGLRFGEYRTTLLGRIEERMPFVGISLPPWLRTKYPHLTSNLKVNEKRLVTWFDIHDALWDVIFRRWDQPRQQWSRFGHSIWYQVPNNRNCADVAIPFNFCPCEDEFALSTSSAEVQSAAETLVKYINSILYRYAVCELVQLKTVHIASRVMPSSSVAVPHGFKLLLRLMVEVSPSNGIFEATLVADAWSNGFSIADSVYRINVYGNQSWCVKDRMIKPYCYCSNQLN